MKTMGLLISHKNGEKRRAILPEDIRKLKHPEYLYIETGYGESVGHNDKEFIDAGANIVSRKEAMNCDIITDVKLGDADYLGELEDGKTLFGWAHAAQGVEFTSKCLEKKFTVVAWEEIFEKGRYIFYRNREIAGEAAIMQAFCYYGRMPYECQIAVIGNGQTAKGALRVLNGLGASVDVYGRKLEKLFLEKKYEYDVIVNCVMWDISRKDRLIYKDDLKKMKAHSMIIDISCDPCLEIETSHPSTIENPVYEVDGVLHYTVDNTPAMFPYTVTKVLSEGNVRMIDSMLTDDYTESLKKAMVIEKGHIRSQSIRDFREARGLFCK